MASTASQGRSRKASHSSRRSKSVKSLAKSASGHSSRAKETWLESFTQTPAFTYIAGGIGFTALATIAYRFAGSYPRITSFFRDNLELIEGKLSEFRGVGSSSDLTDEADEARH